MSLYVGFGWFWDPKVQVKRLTIWTVMISRCCSPAKSKNATKIVAAWKRTSSLTKPAAHQIEHINFYNDHIIVYSCIMLYTCHILSHTDTRTCAQTSNIGHSNPSFSKTAGHHSKPLQCDPRHHQGKPQGGRAVLDNGMANAVVGQCLQNVIP